MNKREGKKIAVMAAVIVGFMVFAFMPLTSAAVTSFTVTPTTGIADAVDSYNVLVTTDGVITIDITIPEEFLAVAPTTGGVEIARVDFWNSSTKTYYGFATITSNKSKPTERVDIYCKLGGLEATQTDVPVDYAPGASMTFESGITGDTSSVKIRLPEEGTDGSIKIDIVSTTLQLDDVMIAIKQFVRNPAAGDYTFYAGTMEAKVSITAPLAYPTVYKGGLWFVDSDGNLIADICFPYLKTPDANDIPLVGDLYGCGDIIIFNDGDWSVDTNGDRWPEYTFTYGGANNTPLVGDVNQDGTDDIVVFYKGLWFVVDPVNRQLVMPPFLYGAEFSTPLVGDVNQDGKDDIVIVTGSAWYVDTDMDQVAEIVFLYGTPDTTPLVGDVNQDGKDDVAVFIDGLWFVDTGYDTNYTPTFVILYGTTGMIPLAGEIR
jgi:hypothetical protein